VVHGQEQHSTRDALHWKWITAHEIGHQYFGEYVLEREEPAWLWIGMGIFADREYTRARDLGPKKHLGLLECYMKGVMKGYDTTIDIPLVAYEKISFDFNNVVTHGKGYAIVSALDCLLGDKTFDRIYKRCLKDFAGCRLGTADFQRICEEESGRSLEWFFDQWVRSNRFLCYKVASQECVRKGNTYHTRVEIECPGTLRMPIPVQAVFTDGSTQVCFTERLLEKNRLQFSSAAPLKEVILDPDQELAMLDDLPPLEKERALIQSIGNLPWTGSGSQALEVFEQVKSLETKAPDAWFQLAMKLFDGKYYEPALTMFRRAYEQESKDSPFRYVNLVWEGHLMDLAGKREKALACYREALDNWTGMVMRHDQYGMVLDKKWIEERIETPFKRP